MIDALYEKDEIYICLMLPAINGRQSVLFRFQAATVKTNEHEATESKNIVYHISYILFFIIINTKYSECFDLIRFLLYI